ncbi:hypothetical protein AB1K70_19160 [Bremerella sp. JC770]|uniref:hypothetical protein n=1 Tax=Bremerella sp. JC770 TaxID=3232137 RepID=UPI0034574AC9
MKHRVKAVDRETGRVRFAEIEAETPDAALRRVNRTKYDASIVETPEVPQGVDKAAAREGAINAALGAPQQKQSDTRRTGEPLDDSVGGLPTWVATGESMKTAQKMMVAFFAVMALGAFGIFAGIQFDQQRITVGHVIVFGVGFAVVALGVIAWKVSSIAKAMQDR